MAEMDTTQDRRCRGRPQVRPDHETRQIIYEAARHEFAASGYAATSMEAVARRAGVSTKTLYRLNPNKASLFEGMVSDRLDRFLANVNLRAVDHVRIEEALYAALLACAELVLDKEVIALQRMVLQEACKSSDIAGMLIGMVASAPQRAAIFGGLPLPSRSQMQARVRTCARLFLRGCQAGRVGGR